MAGNIRELQNVIERAVVVHEKGQLSVHKRRLSRKCCHGEAATQLTFKRSPVRDRGLIGAALAETKGRVSGPPGAAVKLGVPASTLESKIRSMNINRNVFKAYA